MENGTRDTANPSPSEALEGFRRNILRKREKLKATSARFATLGQSESDIYRRVTDKMLGQHATIMEDLFTNIETLAVAQVALKDQLDLLKDIVVQLPDVARNEHIQRDIDRMFNQYTGSH
jgi:hypothetical protein